MLTGDQNAVMAALAQLRAAGLITSTGPARPMNAADRQHLDPFAVAVLHATAHVPQRTIRAAVAASASPLRELRAQLIDRFYLVGSVVPNGASSGGSADRSGSDSRNRTHRRRDFERQVGRLHRRPRHPARRRMALLLAEATNDREGSAGAAVCAPGDGLPESTAAARAHDLRRRPRGNVGRIVRRRCTVAPRSGIRADQRGTADHQHRLVVLYIFDFGLFIIIVVEQLLVRQ